MSDSIIVGHINDELASVELFFSVTDGFGPSTYETVVSPIGNVAVDNLPDPS
jgi:hypothetical protein